MQPRCSGAICQRMATSGGEAAEVGRAGELCSPCDTERLVRRVTMRVSAEASRAGNCGFLTFPALMTDVVDAVKEVTRLLPEASRLSPATKRKTLLDAGLPVLAANKKAVLYPMKPEEVARTCVCTRAAAVAEGDVITVYEYHLLKRRRGNREVAGPDAKYVVKKLGLAAGVACRHAVVETVDGGEVTFGEMHKGKRCSWIVHPHEYIAGDAGGDGSMASEARL